MIISAIFATDLKNAIGKNNQLPWHLPADLRFFKTMTAGFPVLMGRKTYESMGRPLPGRKNIVITRNADFKSEGVEVYHTIEAALKTCEQNLPDATQKIFIIGGAEIFKQAIHITDELYRTLVKSVFEADTFIPEPGASGFKMVWEECHEADEKNKFDYCFQKWVRVK